MEEFGKKQDRRKGMKRWKEKKGSRSSGNLGTLDVSGLSSGLGKVSKLKSPKGSHVRSNSGSLSNRSGLVNFSVPPLLLDTPTKKLSNTGKKFRSHKGNAGFKSRCTDQERWHQYLVDEGNFHEPTFACPFAFVGRAAKDSTAAVAAAAKTEAPPAEAPPLASPGAEGRAQQQAPRPASVPPLESLDKAVPNPTVVEEQEAPKSAERHPAVPVPSPKGSPKRAKKDYTKKQPSLLREMCLYAPRTLSMLSDNLTVVNNVVQYQSLEQFGVKKFSLAEMTEWELAVRESIERHFLEKDKGRSLKNKVRDKSRGVISSTPRSLSRSRAASDAEKKPPSKPSTPQTGGVSSKEIQYGGLRTSINPLLLLEGGQERSRSITHKPRHRGKRSSTVSDGPPSTSFADSPATSDVEEETLELPSVAIDAISAVTAETPPSPPGSTSVPTRNASDKKDHRTFISLFSGKSPRKSEDDSDAQFALPRRSASAKASTHTLSSPSSASSSKLESLLGVNMHDLPQHFIPAGAGQSVSSLSSLVSATDALKSEDEESSVTKSISPLRLFSPRKKGKRTPAVASGSSDESIPPVTTPKGSDQGKKKRPGYFQSLKMQLKTPRGGKAKDDEDAQAHPRKRKSRTPKAKKTKDVVIQRIDSTVTSPLPKPLSSDDASPGSPSRDSDLDSPLGLSPHFRAHSASFDTEVEHDSLGTIAALVDSQVRPTRLSLPIRRAQSRGTSSKSDTEAGLLRSPGPVRFEEEELNPPSDQDED